MSNFDLDNILGVFPGRSSKSNVIESVGLNFSERKTSEGILVWKYEAIALEVWYEAGEIVSEVRVIGVNGPVVACGLRVGMTSCDAFDIVFANFPVLRHEEDYIYFQASSHNAALVGTVEFNVSEKVVSSIELFFDNGE